MASFRNLHCILMEVSRNLSWPLSRPRPSALILSLIVLAFLSATLFKNSSTNPSATLSSRFLLANSLSSFYSIIPTNNQDQIADDEDETALNNAVVTAPKQSINRNESNLMQDLRSCDIFSGKWVVDDSDPVYQPGSCPFIDDAFNCLRNGRPDSDFMRWRWRPDECLIPRLDGKQMLEMLKGKRLVFVGDSLNRNMWQSLVCALRDSLTNKSRAAFEVFGRTQGYYSLRFQDYNSSFEFVRAPFLVQEWKTGARKETLRLDLMQKSSSIYKDADIIIFNTGHWWTHDKTSKGNNYYQEGNFVHNNMAVTEAYSRALHTWARWVDTNIDPSRTRVFFRGYSISHYRGGRWNSGGNCDGETQPITNDTYLAPYPRMMGILESTIREMKTPVFYLNITRMTDYRKDGHPSIYRHPHTQKSGGMYHQDCSHWCLPGVPDAWNELLYAAILLSHQNSD